MAEELTRDLERRAERGSPRGAATVFAAAQRQAVDDRLTRPVWRSGPAIAIAAGAALILGAGLVLGAGLLIPDKVTPSATSTTVAASPIRVEDLVWSRVSFDETVFEDARLDSVTVFGETLVAVGEDPMGGAVWTSPDGVTWTRVSLNATARGHIQEVARGGPGLVAIVDGDNGDKIWTSPDGLTWTPSDQTFGRQLEAITQGGPGLVMVGDGMAYTSADGIEWTPGQCPDCSVAREFDYLVDVTAGGPGLIAVGNTTDEGDGPAFYWTSEDGFTWTRFPFGEVVEMESVTAGGPGFVAVGHSPRGAEVLTSSDGLTWAIVPHDSEVFGGSLMRDVVAIGDGLVALGEWHWGDGKAWTSLDGINWTTVPYDPTVFDGSSINDAVAFGDRLIAVGSTHDPGGEEDAAVWIAAEAGLFEPPVAPESEPTSLVTGEAVNPWTTTQITEPWAEDVVDVAALPEGGFAVATRYGGGVFWSRDGASWRDLNPDGLASLPAWSDDDNLRVISALPGGVAVLGGSLNEPVVWLGELATGTWESIPLDTDGLSFSYTRVVIATSDHEVLVIARGESSCPIHVWLIEPETGAVDHTELGEAIFKRGFSSWSANGLEAEWFANRWVLATGNATAVSDDGLSWTTEEDKDGLATDDRFVTSLTGGAGGIIATTCEWGHYVWYSEDGLDWAKVPDDVPALHSGFAYSDALGFVVVEGGRAFTSADGQTWRMILGLPWRNLNSSMAASGTSLLVIADPSFMLISE